jgi:hypothetical protein
VSGARTVDSDGRCASLLEPFEAHGLAVAHGREQARHALEHSDQVHGAHGLLAEEEADSLSRIVAVTGNSW